MRRRRSTNTAIQRSLFQRDGKQTFLQKFKDFRNGVRSGTELASKYSKELGLPEDAISNPRIKHTIKSNSTDQLNQLFRTTKRRLDENIPFHKSDLLVSHVDSEKNIRVDIKVNNFDILDDETRREIKKTIICFTSAQAYLELIITISILNHT